MRRIDFTMARQGLVEVGQEVKVVEGKLPGSYYYTIDPFLAMSGNFKKTERLHSDKGKVIDIKETSRGYFVTVEFDQ